MLGASRTCAVIGLWLWLGWCPARAFALDFAWTAPAVCPDEAAVRARLDTLLGSRPVPEGASASLRVDPQRNGFRLRLNLGGTLRGSRELSGNDCAALADTGAWLVAVAIDPALSLLPPEPVKPSEPVTEPVPAPAPPPPTLPPPKLVPVEPSPWALHTSFFGGALRAEASPRRAQGELGMSLGVSYRWLLAEVRGGSSLPLSRQLGSGEARSATQTFALSACGLWGARFRAGPCGGLALLRTHVEPNLPERSRERSLFWGQAQLGAQVAVRLARPLELFLEGGAGIPLTPRPRFTVAGGPLRPASALEAAPVSAYGRLGLRLRWPISPAARR